ncbi:tetratricopeptide repeat protein 39A-like isoform X2 [Tachypleus tridentatus]
MFIRAFMTFEAGDINVAMETIKEALAVCQRYRKKFSAFYRILGWSGDSSYTDLEAHAELTYAECLLLNALLTFISDQSLFTFIRGGLKIRSCYQSYKTCLHILDTHKFQTETALRDFESGVHVGLGAFNLLISQLPKRVMRVLEFVGFSGDREFGQKELEKGCDLIDGLRSPLSVILLTGFHSYVTYTLGLCDGKLDLCRKYLDNMLTKYPKGALFLFFDGRVKQVNGKIDEAIKSFDDSISVQSEWKQFHYMCLWEQQWCYCYKCDWNNAAKCANILRKECRWSPATCCYLYASFLYMQVLEGQNDMMDKIISFYRQVPYLRQRLAGKSIPIEKFCVKNAEKFLANRNKLVLPILEFVYMWHGFPVISKVPAVLEMYHNMIEKNLTELKEANGEVQDIDDYLMVTLLQGMCLKYLNHFDQAEQCFREIINREREIKDKSHLPPYAAAELAFMMMEKGKKDDALEWLKAAKYNYHDYLTEVVLHFRLYAAYKKLNGSQEREPESPIIYKPLPDEAPYPTEYDTNKIININFAGIENSSKYNVENIISK